MTRVTDSLKVPINFPCCSDVQEIDHDNSNLVSIDEFKAAVATPKMSSFLESMGISTHDVWTLFTIIDADASGLIDLDEFVQGCMELHGPAKSFHLSKMSYENKITRQAIKKLVRETSDVKKQLALALPALQQTQSNAPTK